MGAGAGGRSRTRSRSGFGGGSGVGVGHARMNNQVEGTCRKTCATQACKPASTQASVCMHAWLDVCICSCSIDLRPSAATTGIEMGQWVHVVSPYFGHRPVVVIGPKESK